MEKDTRPSSHSHSLQDSASLSSRSDQDGVAPFTRGDLLIVAFVSSLCLWATVWALTSAAFR